MHVCMNVCMYKERKRKNERKKDRTVQERRGEERRGQDTHGHMLDSCSVGWTVQRCAHLVRVLRIRAHFFSPLPPL